MQPAVAMLERFGVGTEVRVLSAHRTPLEMVAFAQQAAGRGFKVIIAGAGGDVIARIDRNQRVAALWPLIDPRAHYGLSNTDPKIVAFAEAIGTHREGERP